MSSVGYVTGGTTQGSQTQSSDQPSDEEQFLIALLEAILGDGQSGSAENASSGSENSPYGTMDMVAPSGGEGDGGDTVAAATGSTGGTGGATDTTATGGTSTATTAATTTGCSDSGQVVQTGTGTGQFYNVTNNTDQPQTFAFSSGSSNTSGYSNNVNATMTLQPGQTGTFESGSNVSGIRISTSGANGETNGDEALYEDTTETNPMTGSGTVHNPDVSDVQGTVGYKGDKENITINDGTRTIGNGTETGAYVGPYDDQNKDAATNPMNMALDSANTYNITFSDA